MEAEGFPLYERTIDRSEVVTALSESPDPSRCETYLLWRKQQESMVINQGANLDFILEDAAVCREAGLIEEAQDAYEAGRAQAYEMHLDALVENLDRIIAELSR